ncbi:hypothetical protein LOK49_LG07G03272 [Camellia lanceoleosa]|uniref:Uncharacterized protein n=1 Tax=Camellia lanceoleosa TaxID=1840588 RepID=A0ACC0H0P4_9ERIC|nr:hypothetical protein LOK49_LG07G03272 [Camellia lanceoleosa]
MSQEKKMKQTVESAHGGENPQKKQMKQKQTLESGHGGEIPQKKKMKQTVESVHGAENRRNDEDIAILQGILDYHSRNGRYPEKYVKRELCRKIWGDVGAEKTVDEQCNNVDINVNVEVVGEEEQDLSMSPELGETIAKEGCWETQK